MRYYDITVGPLHYTSLGGDGHANPGALNVELDISCNAQDIVQSGSWIRVWGIGLQAISQTNNLFDKPVIVKGGMSAGLPLANPSQAGYLFQQGKVFRAFGNWVGVDQTLDIIMTASAGAAVAPGQAPTPSKQPIVLDWKKGQDLTQPLQQALQKAFPGWGINMLIGSNYKPPSDQQGYSFNAPGFGAWLRQYTKMLGGAKSQGVGLVFQGGKIHVMDGSKPASGGGPIQYQDLIGQPTWIDVDKISIKVVMRGDLMVGQNITLPKTLVTNTVGGGHSVSGQANPQQSLTFQGTFQITSLRHIGNFRQPDGQAWVTVIEAITQSGGSGAGSSGDTFTLGNLGRGGIGHQ